MRRARRSAHLFLRLSDELLPDVARLLQGEVELVRSTRLRALSILTGREHDVTGTELRLLTALSSEDWTHIGEPDADTVHGLARAGLVVTDSNEEPLADLRRRDELLGAIGWDPHAAFFHVQSKWQDVDVGEMPVAPPPEALPRRTPPGPFHTSRLARESIELPLEQPDTGVFRLLLERRTTRDLDPEGSLTLDELGLLLYFTFGCQGYADLGDGIVVLRKTSPSGGALHPVEAYPLVIRVEGLAPGVYHYRADTHALELLSPLDSEVARERLLEFVAGQHYLASASVLVVMAARFDRSFWKYRHPRAYSVLHLDAGHISQTLYLVAAELGLGAFVSAAVNAGNVEEHLGLDGFEQGVLAVCGVGRPTHAEPVYDATFEPYVPRETVIRGD